MHPPGKRILLLIVLGLMAIPVAAVGVAYACTALATVATDRASAIAGSAVTVTGKGFAPHDPADIRSTPAVIHMDSASGPVLGEASPSSNNTGGVFSVAITVPTADPGDHILVVTQNGTDGTPAFGTPARTVLTIDPTPVAPAVVAPIAVPVPLGTVPVVPTIKPLTAAQKLARAIAKCKTTFNVNRAKTAVGKKRVASRRSSCIRKARKISAA